MPSDSDDCLTAHVLIKELGADVGAKDKNGMNVAHIAARDDHCELLRTLIEEYGVRIDDNDNDGLTTPKM